MNLSEIEELVRIARDAKVSELTVSIGGSTVKLRKPLTPAAKPRSAAKSAAPKASQSTASQPEPASNEVYITAPMVGIFHGLESIGAVESPIKTGQTVGVIESMKLMNDVVSEYDGVIAEIIVEDGMPVEYGQKLIKLTTS